MQNQTKNVSVNIVHVYHYLKVSSNLAIYLQLKLSSITCTQYLHGPRLLKKIEIITTQIKISSKI